MTEVHNWIFDEFDLRPSLEQVGNMYLNLGQMHAFMRVARRRSFLLAAQELAIFDRAISQEIIELEKSLGKRLIVRDTRFRSLTACGKTLLG
jgi:DNA-binding transcriptional LysR family regulator